MKVLVTGTHGQLAASLVERAPAHRGIDILAVGRPDLDLERSGSAAAIVDALHPDFIVNTAAYTAVDQAEDEPERAMRVNAEGAAELAAAAAAIGAPIVQISTDYVFDGADEQPYGEDAPTNPLNVYGRSKLAGEDMVREANASHFILRTAWIYSRIGQNFVKTMLRLAQTRDRIAVIDDQRGNPSAALDLADGIFAILECWRSGDHTGLGGTYHLAGTGTASWCEFAREIFEECAQRGLPAPEVDPIRTADRPAKAIRPANSTLDSSRFARDFGFRMPDWHRSAAEVIDQLAEPGLAQ